MTVSNKNKNNMLKKFPINNSALSLPLLLLISIKRGTKELFIAPSANSLLKKFGILNASKKLSAPGVAPKAKANIRSLT